MMRYHWKDVLIGLFAAWVSMELLLKYATKTQYPGLFKGLKQAMNDENFAIVIAGGLAVGLIVFYMSMKTKEYFVMKRE